MTRLWTPARNALLARDYPAGVPTDVLFAALNALPGPPIPVTSKRALERRAAVLGVRRPKDSRSLLARARFAASSNAVVETPPPLEPLPPVETDLATVTRWAARHAPKARRLEEVNAVRQAHGVPPWRVVRREGAGAVS